MTGTEKVTTMTRMCWKLTPEAAAIRTSCISIPGVASILRSVNHRRTPGGAWTFSANIADYREVDGVKLPFRVEQVEFDQSAFTIKFTDVQHNVDLADSLFAKPAGEPPAGPPAEPSADPAPK